MNVTEMIDTMNVTNSSYHNEESKEFYDIVVKYFMPVIVSFGVLGNILSFIIFQRKWARQNSFSVYLSSLCVIDTLYLINETLFYWSPYIESSIPDMVANSDIGCKLFSFGIVLPIISGWIVVGATVDRTIAVFAPFKMNKYCTRKRAWVVTGLIIGINSATYLYSFWAFGITEEGCSIVDDVFYVVFDIDTYITFIVHGIFQSVLLLALSVSIVIRTINQRRHRISLGIQSSTASQAARKITVLVLGTSVSFLILTTPVSIGMVIQQSQAAPGSSLLEIFSNNTLNAVSGITGMLNGSLNFFIFGISGERFRQEFREMFCVKFERTFLSSSRGQGSSRTTVTDVKCKSCSTISN